MKAREEVIFEGSAEKILQQASTIRALTEALRMINESKGGSEADRFQGKQRIADLNENWAEQERQIRRLNSEIDRLNEELSRARAPESPAAAVKDTRGPRGPRGPMGPPGPPGPAGIDGTSVPTFKEKVGRVKAKRSK